MLAILAILAIGPLIILIKSIPANPADGSFPLRIMFVTVPLAIIVLIVLIWLVVSTPLKNISQWEGLSHMLLKIKNV